MSIEKFSFQPKNLKEMVKDEIADGIEKYKNDKKNEGDNNIENLEKESVPKELVDTEAYLKMYGIDQAKELYEWYEKAMKRRGRESLEEESFLYHFFRGGSLDESYMFGDNKHGYLLGSFKYKIFTPSHFAPKSLRKGYELFKDLGNSKVPAVLFITQDLADTLSKMPEWKIEDIEIPSFFRGEDEKKKIAHNKFPGYEEKLKNMAKEYLDEYYGNYEEDDYDD